jgi:hypothetical protein
MSAESSDGPEKMGAFFDRRVEGYDAHMQRSVSSFEAFYAAVAQPIPRTQGALHILDIGCGTGLEEERLINAFRDDLERGSSGAEEGAYHVGIPLALETQCRLLLEAGFAGVEVIWHEGAAAVYAAQA